MIKYFIGFLVGFSTSALLFLWMQRRQQPVVEEAPVVASEQAETLGEDFLTFYEQFHADSIFQVNHITWPLDGLPSNADSATLVDGNYKWTPENWVFHRPLDEGNQEFTRQQSTFGDGMVIEIIKHQSGQYGMIRRFAKLGDEWHLIYYAGMNKIN